MSLYRGAGGASDATDDSTVNAVAGYASAAASSASAAATSATEASNSATASASSASSAATSASSVATNATNASNSAALAANSAALALTYRNSAFTNRNLAQTAAGNASVSEANAATSAASAATSATSAANSATAAAGSATSAASSASSASSSAANALAIYGNTTAMNNAVTAAATSATNASTYAADANDSRVLAEAAVAGASGWASTSQAAANSAQGYATAALSARDATLAAYDSFDDRYLGVKSADPTVDNDGNPLVAGSLYFNDQTNMMMLRAGNAWVAAYTSGGSPSFGNTVVNGTLGVTGAVTLSGGTANGVAYLNGSKVLTSGSALTFDGTNLGVGAASYGYKTEITSAGSQFRLFNSGAAAERLGVNVDSSGVAFTAINTSGTTLPYIWNGSSELMRLTSTGLGIGTSSPGEKLVVAGNVSSTLASSVGQIVLRNSSTTSAELHVRPNSGKNGWLSFTEDSVADRWVVGVKTGNGSLFFNTGSVVSNTDRMVLNSSGNLGLGVTPSASTLKMLQGPADFVIGTQSNGLYLANNAYYNAGWKYAGGGAPSRFSQDNGAFQWHTAASGTAGNAISFTQAMTLDASGNVLVGKTSTATSAEGALIGKDAGGCYLTLGYTGTGTVNSAAFFRGTSGSLTQVGSISTTGSATAYNTSSDYRLKENIQPMTGALAKVAQLKPCTYNWKADGSTGEGFIAHELQAVVPQCVTGEKDAVDTEGKPVYQGIDTSFLVATLTAALQEAVAEINQLKARLDAANL